VLTAPLFYSTLLYSINSLNSLKLGNPQPSNLPIAAHAIAHSRRKRREMGKVS